MGQVLCYRCQQLNPIAATFCEYCGNSLAARKKTLSAIKIALLILGGLFVLTILFMVVVFLIFFLMTLNTFH